MPLHRNQGDVPEADDQHHDDAPAHKGDDEKKEDQTMPGSGTETRQRQISLKARFTTDEAALIRAQADRAGVSVAALIRYAVLGQSPLPSSRRPPLDRQQTAQLIASLGALACALRQAATGADDHGLDDALDGGLRDLTELRTLALEAMGRAP